MTTQTLKTVDRPKPPLRKKNAELRSREHLTEAEIKRLVNAAGSSVKNHFRDNALVRVMFRHGLRGTEVIALRWDMVDFAAAILHVRRVKNGTSTTHPLQGSTLRSLRAWKREQASRQGEAAYVFTTNRRTPMTTAAVRRVIQLAGIEAGFNMPIHPHMLRHSCGYYLASKGIDTRAIQLYLGHKNIQNTVIYTTLSPDRFKNFWPD
jgi:site-specific recombinase XerD